MTESQTEREIQLNRMLNESISVSIDQGSDLEEKFSSSGSSSGGQYGRQCPPRVSRGLSWPWTVSGTQSSQACPRGSQGVAVWGCGPAGAWTGPAADLSHCSSHWARSLLSRARAGEEVAGQLAELTESRALYGGDLVLVAEILQATARTRQGDTRAVAESLQKAASSVLDTRREETWRDLRPPARAAAATSLLLALQENFLLLASSITQQTERRDLSRNILSCITVINTPELESLTFPGPSLMEGAEVTVSAETLSQLRDSEGVVRVVFLLYSSLDRSLPSSTNGVKFLNSRVVTALAPQGRSVRLRSPLSVTLSHLEAGPRVSAPSCARWDVASRSWSSHHCHLAASNTSHTTCHCRQFGDFALLMEESPQQAEEEASSHISTIVGATVSILAGVFLTLIITCLIRRLSLKSDSGLQGLQGLQGCLHCRRVSKAESHYPAMNSSPTSTTLSGTPTTITSMSSNYFLQSECPAQLQQVKSIYEVEPGQLHHHHVEPGQLHHHHMEPGQLHHPSVIPVSQLQVRDLRSGYLRPVSPLGHIYMEIDPVYGTRPDLQHDLSDEEVRRPLIRSSLRTVSGSFRQQQQHQPPPPISIALSPGGEHFVSLNLEQCQPQCQPPYRGYRTVNRQRPQ